MMKMRRIITAATALTMAAALGLGASGCAQTVKAKDLLQEVKPGTVQGNLSKEEEQLARRASADFAFALLQRSYEGTNTLLSPVSVELALAMLANGATGENLTQMEEVLGGGYVNSDQLNAFLHAYCEQLSNTKEAKLQIANSVWFNRNAALQVKEEFLGKIKAYYQAGIFEDEFDEDTRKEINKWCSDHTDHMIPKALDRIEPDCCMILVNAINFDAKWEKPYEADNIIRGTFYPEEGKNYEVDYLHSTEGRYLENDYCYGVAKYYKDGYSFVALLPEDGYAVSDVVEKLSGEDWIGLVDSMEYDSVITAIPKFTFDGDYNMSNILKEMGMTDAFELSTSSFALIDDIKPLAISRVIHKTHIDLDENGTKAAAITIIDMKCEAAAPAEEPRVVNLNRPFVYAIVDDTTRMPIFLGVAQNPGR